MNLSELCIRRPVMVVLLSISLVLVGILSYMKIPVAAMPSYNTPVINVSANLPGASPETMASSVALPLEKQFSTIAGIKLITSSSTQATPISRWNSTPRSMSTRLRSTSRPRCWWRSAACRSR